MNGQYFNVRDMVDILSWDLTTSENRTGIDSGTWGRAINQNPHRVISVESESHVYLDKDNFKLYWNMDALQYHDIEKYPNVDDLI